MELILLVCESDFEMVGHITAFYHSQDHIEIWRSHLFRVSLALSCLCLENERYSVFLEVLFAESSELVESGENFAILIIESNFFVNWTVVSDVRCATKDTEVWIFVFVSFFSLELIFVDVDFEIVY